MITITTLKREGQVSQMNNTFIPQLPPKQGYAEIEKDGKRIYKNIKTNELIEPPIYEPTAEERLSALESAMLAMMEG